MDRRGERRGVQRDDVVNMHRTRRRPGCCMDRGCHGGTGRQTQGRAAVHGTVFGIIVRVQSAPPGCKRLEKIVISNSASIEPRRGKSQRMRSLVAWGSIPADARRAAGAALAVYDRDLEIRLHSKQPDDFSDVARALSSSLGVELVSIILVS